MAFQGTVTMSLATKRVTVTNTSIVDTPANWTVYSISTPGPTGLKKSRWTFSAPAPQGTYHIADLNLGPGVAGNKMDEELIRLASIGEQITLKVTFNGVPKEDLYVDLTP